MLARHRIKPQCQAVRISDDFQGISPKGIFHKFYIQFRQSLVLDDFWIEVDDGLVDVIHCRAVLRDKRFVQTAERMKLKNSRYLAVRELADH